MQPRIRTAATTRRLTAAAVATALALTLAGCSGGGGHALGDGVNTKLNGSTFSGNVVIRATKVERVTNAALKQFGLTAEGDTAYFAHATVHVAKGTVPSTAADDFGNAAWGLQAGGKLQAGPKLSQSDRSDLLQGSCPFDPASFARTLRNGGTAKLCAVLLAPTGSTVTGVSYLRAAPVDQGADGDSTITWTAAG
jgi:hypothetical protein